MPLPLRNFTLTRIADTTNRFREFAPYVASVNDAGIVAFQAALTNGGSGVFTADGTDLATVSDTNGTPIRDVVSHPAINASGGVSFYAELESGERGIFLMHRGELVRVGGERASGIGPLGPTMNDANRVAFRAQVAPDVNGIFVGTGDDVRMVASTEESYAAFWGLPVIANDGSVVFRADLKFGGQGIYVANGSDVTMIVNTSDDFATLGFFPSMNDHGTVVFAGTLREGGGGIFAASRGEIVPVIDMREGFESLRGAWINNRGDVLFAGTPTGRTLGIYAGANPRVDRIIGLGDALFGSTVSDFAANPVSLNNRGQLAIRVVLASGREVIVRADPGE